MLFVVWLFVVIGVCWLLRLLMCCVRIVCIMCSLLRK